MTFVVLNLFISVILVAFSQEQIHHKVTQPRWAWEVLLCTYCRRGELIPWQKQPHMTWYFLTYIYYSLFPQPSEEDEIVDLMLMKLCSLFGLKCKKQDGVCLPERPVISSASNDGLSTISWGWKCSSTVIKKFDRPTKCFALVFACHSLLHLFKPMLLLCDWILALASLYIISISLYCCRSVTVVGEAETLKVGTQDDVWHWYTVFRLQYILLSK